MCAVALMVGGLLPALYLTATGRPVDRLIGVELTSSVVTVAMLLVSDITAESYELIVPIVLVALSLAGALVFTRLIGGVQDGP